MARSKSMRPAVSIVSEWLDELAGGMDGGRCPMLATDKAAVLAAIEAVPDAIAVTCAEGVGRGGYVLILLPSDHADPCGAQRRALAAADEIAPGAVDLHVVEGTPELDARWARQ